MVKQGRIDQNLYILLHLKQGVLATRRGLISRIVNVLNQSD